MGREETGLAGEGEPGLAAALSKRMQLDAAQGAKLARYITQGASGAGLPVGLIDGPGPPWRLSANGWSILIGTAAFVGCLWLVVGVRLMRARV